jgi:hypothetical protein
MAWCNCTYPISCEVCDESFCWLCETGICDVDDCNNVICQSCSTEYKFCILCAEPINVNMCDLCFHDTCALYLECDDCKLLNEKYERSECVYADMSDVLKHLYVKNLMSKCFQAMILYAEESTYKPGGNGYKRLRNEHSGQHMLRRSARIDDKKNM